MSDFVDKSGIGVVKAKIGIPISHSGIEGLPQQGGLLTPQQASYIDEADSEERMTLSHGHLPEIRKDETLRTNHNRPSQFQRAETTPFDAHP